MFPAQPSSLLIAALLAFVAVWAAMPLAARVWRSLGYRDAEISLRKVHEEETPRVGGLVAIAGFSAVVLVGLAGVGELSQTHELLSLTPLSGVLWGGLIVGLAGLWDDVAGLRPRAKLLAHVGAATVAVAHGLHFEALAQWLGPQWHPMVLVVTVVFLVVATNAVNLLDGIDGLAGGVLVIAFVAVWIAATATGDGLSVGWTAAAAAGACAGFLVHNRHPARVFMGDGGAYFGGFVAAGLLLCIEPVRPRVAPLELAIPVMVLALPLFDTSIAIARRWIRGQSIFAGDGDHVHHRLLAAGMSQVQAVRVLWAMSASFAGLALLDVYGVGGWWTLLGALIATGVSAVALGYHRLLERLPVFGGESTRGWSEGRRRTRAALLSIRCLGDTQEQNAERHWVKVIGPLADILSEHGIPRAEVWGTQGLVVGAGAPTATWGTLSLPIPDCAGFELRLALRVPLVRLQPQHHALVEAALVAVAAAQSHRRGTNVVPLRPAA